MFQVATKLAHLVVVLFFVSVGAFLIVDLFPGDPVATIIGLNGTAEQAATIRAELGLDEPIVSRYLSWIGGVLTGDFGRNLVPPVEDVSTQLSRRFPVTLQIASMALVMAVMISVPLGVWSAHRAGRRSDRVASAVTFGVISVPNFLAGLFIVFFFIFHDGIVRTGLVIALAAAVVSVIRPIIPIGRDRDDRPAIGGRLAVAAGLAALAVLAAVAWPDFPRQGFTRISEDLSDNLRSAFLPAFTLALAEAAVFTRLLRKDTIETLQEDYIQFARAKGLPERRVLLTHALQPSSLSLVTLAGISFGRLLGGTVIVESVFRVPGMGTWIVGAVSSQDFPVVQAGVLVLAATFVVLNALVDLLYLRLDPRLRHGR